MTPNPKDDFMIVYWTLEEQKQERKKIRQQTAQEIFEELDSVDIYHEIGKVKIWQLSNDGVVDEVVDFIKEQIKQKYIGDRKQ